MADKTIVQKPVKKGDLSDLHLYITPSGQNWNALYTPKDAAGAPIGTPRTLTGVLAHPQELFAWVDLEVIPAINAAEGT